MGLMVIIIFLLLCVFHSNRLQVWIAIDQFVNALLWGWADETLSARAWRCQFKKRRWMWVVETINLIVFWQINHCKRANESEHAQRHIAPEYRPESAKQNQ